MSAIGVPKQTSQSCLFSGTSVFHICLSLCHRGGRWCDGSDGADLLKSQTRAIIDVVQLFLSINQNKWRRQLKIFDQLLFQVCNKTLMEKDFPFIILAFWCTNISMYSVCMLKQNVLDFLHLH